MVKDDKVSSDPAIPISWARWNYGDKYLPKEFYGKPDHPDSLESLVNWIKSEPWRDPVTHKMRSPSYIQNMFLALGMATREYDYIHFMDEDDYPEDLPTYARDTKKEGYDSLFRTAYGIVTAIGM